MRFLFPDQAVILSDNTMGLWAQLYWFLSDWPISSSDLMYYESSQKELTSRAFEHLIYNLKSYNGIKI